VTDLIVADKSVPAQTKFNVAQTGASCPARLQERGARYHGQNDFIRYPISGLDLWMSPRADEIRGDELSTVETQPASSRMIPYSKSLHSRGGVK
jgi:hypothetical protein